MNALREPTAVGDRRSISAVPEPNRIPPAGAGKEPG
jgi:hypothetical protein